MTFTHLRSPDQPEPFRLDVALKGDVFSVTLEGVLYEGRLVRTTPGSGWLLLKREGAERVLPFHVLKTAETLSLWINGHTVSLERLLPGARRSRQKETVLHNGEIVAPLPGIILKTPVKPGEKVPMNAPLAILESMKMEITLSAPMEAVVKERLCTEGQMVDKGALLIRLEPASPPVT